MQEIKKPPNVVVCECDTAEEVTIYCFENNPWVKEEKSYSFPVSEVEDENGGVVWLLALKCVLPLLEALSPMVHVL